MGNTDYTIRQQWLNKVSSINTWKQGDLRAPHKPLLLLMLLARAYRKEQQAVHFEEICKPLEQLLREFGPSRKTHHPELPFWYLKNDGFWVVDHEGRLPPKKGSTNPSRATLLQNNATGRITDNLWKALVSDQQLIWELARIVLDEYWPATLHLGICQAIGLPDMPPERQTSTKAKRDPRFREELLRAYESRCAVCGYDGRLSNMPLGLEAAHIRWHSYEGPDDMSNGLALCSYHHIAFDSGAFGISTENRIQVSADVTGSNMVDELLMQFMDKPLRIPIRSYSLPADVHLEWHRQQVFRSPAR